MGTRIIIHPPTRNIKWRNNPKKDGGNVNLPEPSNSYYVIYTRDAVFI
jgi:hypothetical protein